MKYTFIFPHFSLLLWECDLLEQIYSKYGSIYSKHDIPPPIHSECIEVLGPSLQVGCFCWYFSHCKVSRDGTGFTWWKTVVLSKMYAITLIKITSGTTLTLSKIIVGGIMGNNGEQCLKKLDYCLLKEYKYKYIRLHDTINYRLSCYNQIKY